MSRFLASVLENGMIIPKEPKRVSRYAGKDVWMELHEHPTQGLRSDPANRYLWGVVYRRIAEETGNDPESVHYGLKRLAVEQGVLPPEYILAGSKLLEAEPTTKQESVVFWAYVGWIREGCETGSLLGMQFHVPDPNEWEDVTYEGTL